MTDRPIIFSAPMVRALLDGRKTQTRRVLKPLWRDGANQQFTGWRSEQVGPRHWQILGGMGVGANIKTPYAVGDRLYVLEAFVTGYDIDDEYGRPTGDKKVWYRATDSNLTWYDPDTESTLDNPPWKPSIHMPRWASRLTLTVTDVRVQRLQQISEADAVAEGCDRDADGWRDYLFPSTQCCGTARDSYRTLWNSLHGPDAWDANPWVVALSFTVHRGNIDQIGGDA